MYGNREEQPMPSRSTPMDLYQGSNEKMRKTHRSICHNSIQKCTSPQRNGMRVGDRPDVMARNPEEKVVNLGQLVRGDPRIRTPLDRKPSKI